MRRIYRYASKGTFSVKENCYEANTKCICETIISDCCCQPYYPIQGFQLSNKLNHCRRSK